MWDNDIEQYCFDRNKDFDRVEDILIRGGWNPDLYQSHMIDDLYNYLDDWYTLSIKNLPKPATSRRRNPSRWWI